MHELGDTAAMAADSINRHAAGDAAHAASDADADAKQQQARPKRRGGLGRTMTTLEIEQGGLGPDPEMSDDNDDAKGSSPKSPVKKQKSSALPSHLECTDLATKILGVCLQEPEDVWDEVYCMLMKQTTANPMREGRRRGWHLFAMVSTTLPPSPALMPCVEDHLRINIEDKSDPAVAKYATRTM